MDAGIAREDSVNSGELKIYYHGNVKLCDVCDRLRDIDFVMSQRDIDLHKSYKDMSQAADLGCQMCQAFIQCQGKTRPGRYRNGKPIVEDGLEEKQRQISLVPRLHGRKSSVFYVRQDKNAHMWNVAFYDPLSDMIYGRPVDSRSDSDSSLNTLSTWIDTCKSEHKICSWDEESVLPARVIDVGSEDQDPRLVTTNGETGSWVTLSHCWGGQVAITTTEETLSQRHAAIPLDVFPPSFQDAVILTRKLGFKYIWIDSLCIIQNCREDWNRESVKMYEVYSNSALNISATASRNAKEGIFETANGRRSITMRNLLTLPSFSNSKTVKGQISWRRFTLGESVYNEPLHRRAWVLQESVLSPRRIDFASGQTYWSCRTTSLCESFPHIDTGDNETLIVSAKDLFRMEATNHAPNPVCHPVGPYNTPISWWDKMLHSFFKREVSVHSDLLPAVAGVAAKIEERSGYTYKAGLWLEDFHRGLLWQSHGSVEKVENATAPSWSWASRKQPWHPRFLFLDVYEEGHRAKILDHQVRTVSESPYSQVANSRLEMEGFARPLTFWNGESIPVFNNMYGYDLRLFNQFLENDELLESEKPIPVGRILCTIDYKDSSEDTADQQHANLVERGVICFQIAKFGHRSHNFQHLTREFIQENVHTIFGLLLEPTGKEGEYERVGLVEIPDEIATGWDKMKVVIA
ncbi:heterokaryon incompatibility protein-domain-containing protein [Halenospora varia]|nr:heterokaryon incompatibility protein-domain-containing protein [Halenospora varia]